MIGKILPKDDDYPSCLKGETLYYAGNRGLLSGILVTVTGTKNADVEGIKNAKAFAEELINAGLTPVTGFATGIEKAVAETGKCICILPCGLEKSVVYPKGHFNLYNSVIEKGGLLLSLEEPNAIAARWTFSKRNDFLAKISAAFLVVQAGEKSTTVKTAEKAEKVYTIPGSITNERYGGNNLLLKKGAKAVTSPSDILEDFGIIKEKTIENTECSLPEKAERILKLLEREMHLEEIMLKAELTMPEVSEGISDLEIYGLVQEVKPCVYAKIRR